MATATYNAGTPTAATEIIPGVNVLVMGSPGAGKTTSLKTLADAGLEVFVIFMDTGMEVAARDPRIHWTYIRPTTGGWMDLMDSAKKINSMAPDSLQKLSGINKSSYMEFIEVLTACNNFKDQHGKLFGDISDWMTDRVIVIDQLTGLSKASKNLTVGSKPSITQPEWGIMMDNLSRFLDKICLDTKCHFVLLAHIEPERDEVTGAIQNMVSTLGRKLAPTIPVNFSEVILAYREGNNFYWSTNDSRTNLKTRHLKLDNRLPQDFHPIIEHWKESGGVIIPTTNR